MAFARSCASIRTSSANASASKAATTSRTRTLLEFAAENPTRRGRLPRNIAAIAKTVLDAGGAADRASVDSALALAASSSVARACGVQRALIDVLCDDGADPNAALHAGVVLR